MQEPTTSNSQRALYSKAQPNVPAEGGGENDGELKDRPRQTPKPEANPAKDAPPISFPVPDVQPT
jgi:hypothetical protein